MAEVGIAGGLCLAAWATIDARSLTLQLVIPAKAGTQGAAKLAAALDNEIRRAARSDGYAFRRR